MPNRNRPLSVSVAVGPFETNLKHRHSPPFTTEASNRGKHPHPCKLKFEFTAASQQDVTFYVGPKALEGLNRRVQEFFAAVFEIPHEQLIQDLFWKIDDELDAVCDESGFKRTFHLTAIEMTLASKPDEFEHIDGEGVFTVRAPMPPAL